VQSTAWAQATIAGAVKDSSGAVLPGVTVEAASPELIEKVRTTSTDGAGRYRIENLRPGTYSVTFTLPGFATVKRDGLLVSGSTVIAVDADMRVGGVQETVTVTGETPVVDVQSTKREIALDNETLRSLPRDPVVDLSFIDADKGSYRAYYEEILPRTRPSGLILFDNVLWFGRVLDRGSDDADVLAIQELNDFLVTDPRVESVMLPIADGLTICRKREEA